MIYSRVRFVTASFALAALLSPAAAVASLDECASVYICKVEATPDYTQTDPAFDGFPNGGRMYCGPVCVSNSLMWLAENGYPRLAPFGGDRKRDQHLLIRTLGSRQYMRTSPDRGTPPTRMLTGLKRFVQRAGYACTIEYRGYNSVPREFGGGRSVPDLDWIREGLRGDGAVWLNIGWYDYDAKTDTHTRRNGHWVTLVGFGHDGNGPDPDYLVIHNPARNATRTVYARAVPIESGRLDGNVAGFPRSAVGFHRLIGGILDGAIVLRMK